MVEVTPDRDPACSRRTALQVPEPEFSSKTPAGRRSSAPVPTSAPGGQPDPTPVIPTPVIISLGAAGLALCDHFLANADRSDHAANDELVTELGRRIRSRQAAPEASE
jgi:hypothetical protein